MSEKPKVLVLGPITPTVDSAQSDHLRYEKLLPAAKKARDYELPLQSNFWEAKDGSLDEEESARQLAMSYLLRTAERLIESQGEDSKELWSDRYTQATSEIYGEPSGEVAIRLMTIDTANIISRAREQNVESGLVDHFEGLCDSFGITYFEEETEKNEFSDAAKLVHEYLSKKYAHVFEALELDSAPNSIDPSDIASRFEAAIKVLAYEHDSDWLEWKVERNHEKDQLSVEAGDKKIIVGMNRASVTPDQLKGLFCHEVLVHAQRALRGSKVSKELGSGLPGYLDAEEGLGVFFEYAITGNVPTKNVDRYVDIALAMGKIDSKEHTRAELIDFVYTRAKIRNSFLPPEHQEVEDEIKKATYAHVNRIYRGSLGNEHVGVFTKDIAYQKGFMDIGKYISDRLEDGLPIGEIIEYLLRGKFDPTTEKHVEIVGPLAI